MTSRTHIQIYKNINTQFILRVCIGLVLCMIGVYVYTLISTTMLVAEKRSLESDIQELHSEISKKEMNYLALSDVLDENQLLAYGFHEAQKVHFISEGKNSDNIAFVSSQ